jgi:hypothetical protein
VDAIGDRGVEVWYVEVWYVEVWYVE